MLDRKNKHFKEVAQHFDFEKINVETMTNPVIANHIKRMENFATKFCTTRDLNHHKEAQSFKEDLEKESIELWKSHHEILIGNEALKLSREANSIARGANRRTLWGVLIALAALAISALTYTYDKDKVDKDVVISLHETIKEELRSEIQELFSHQIRPISLEIKTIALEARRLKAELDRL